MHRLPHAVPSLLLVVLVCSAAGCLAAAEHRCNFDAITKKADMQPIAVVREMPQRGRGAWQAYTASVGDRADGWTPLRIAVSTLDLEKEENHCMEEGDMRPTFRGYNTECREGDLFTMQKKHELIDKIIPTAIKLHTDRLLVQRDNTDAILQALKTIKRAGYEGCRHGAVLCFWSWRDVCGHMCYS
ncbi:Peptidase M8 [Trypanosoma melophagium]|uniref:Peptidase M8 n=1 Tax=Trypanosoma melophagium TaxID=715481 RepID=UPI00351AA4FC|nr:Peptidase M8 [Trypanosoma melophagium]